MKPTQRVVWSEGMLVSPQHLQQADLYHERLLGARVGALAAFDWGVTSCEVDVGALGAGQVRVTRFVGVLPDGLFLSFEGGDAEAAPSRAIEGHFPAAQSVLEVFLATPKERDGVPSVLQDGAATRVQRTRFRATTRPVTDLTGQGAELAMAFAQRNVGILFGDEPKDDYDLIKIAEVARNGAGALIVNEAYIPPILRIGASPFLTSGLRRLLALAVSRQRQLSDERRQRDKVSVEFSSNDVTRYLQLNTLNTIIPILSHLGQFEELPPHDLYLFLIQAAGQLTTFSPDADPSKFPPFTYTDLRATFEELLALITALLRATVRELYLTVALNLTQGVFLGKVDDDRAGACPQFVLAVRAEGFTEEQVAQRLPGLCKMASAKQLPQIVRAAAPGIPVQVIHRPPQEIPVRPGVVYFMVNLQSDQWKHVLDDKTVAIYLLPPFDSTKVKLELLGIPPRGA